MLTIRPFSILRSAASGLMLSATIQRSSATLLSHQMGLRQFSRFSQLQGLSTNHLNQKKLFPVQANRLYGSLAHRYLDPRNDLAFKRIFGTDKHKSLPIDFLNAALNLDGQDRIVDLEFLNSVQTPEIDARKESIVDVLVKDQRGVKYIVEMQVAKVEGFEKRAQYYAAKTYCAHFAKGKKYEELKKVVFLALTDYVVFPGKKSYKSDRVILDRETYENNLKDFSFTFVELPKFTKTLDQLTTIEDQWYYFIKHADESENIKEVLSKHPQIREAYTVLDRSRWTEEDLYRYEKNIMDIADMLGMVDAAKNEGEREGVLKGRREGVQEATKQIALKLFRMRYPIEEITELTGLSSVETASLTPRHRDR